MVCVASPRQFSLQGGLDFAEHCPHSNRQGFDFAQPLKRFGIDLRFVQQEELRLGQQGRERIREVVAKPAKPLGFRHSAMGREGARQAALRIAFTLV
jgi:hypothetical protein